MKSIRPCKYCGKANLIWKETEQGWQLYNEDGSLHECWKIFDLYNGNKEDRQN